MKQFGNFAFSQFHQLEDFVSQLEKTVYYTNKHIFILFVFGIEIFPTCVFYIFFFENMASTKPRMQNMNIAKDNVSGNCDLKCAYNFKYPITTLVAKNIGVMLSVTCDKSRTPPVLYNTDKYVVDKFILVSPSVHTFNGTTASAELLINHSPIKGGNQLVVAVPIKESSEGSTATTLLTELINGVSSGAPASGESVALNIDNFTLNSIVPKQPFYSYLGTAANEATDYIVFDMIDAIALSSNTLTSLKEIIRGFPIPTPGRKLFFNKLGPNQSPIGDGVYISCQPTGSSEEEIEVESSKNQTVYDLFSFDSSTSKTFVQILVSLVLFLLLFGALGMGYTYIAGRTGSASGLKKGIIEMTTM